MFMCLLALQGGRHNVRDAANRQFAAEDDMEDLAEHPRRLKPGQRLEVREDEGQELSQEEIHEGIKDTVEEVVNEVLLLAFSLLFRFLF